MQRHAVKEEGYKRMTSPAFRPHGIRYSLHDMMGMAKEDWEKMLFPDQLSTAQDYYLKLVKRTKLTAAQRKHLNGLKRWFNIQKWTHKPWRSRIENFFRTRVKRVRDNKERMSLKETPDKKPAEKPAKEASLRRGVVRLAFANTELREVLLSLLRDC
jgi:hypothetical protein